VHCQRAIEDMNERCIQRHPQRCKRTSCAISQGCRADIWLWRLTAPWPCSAGVGSRHHHSLSGCHGSRRVELDAVRLDRPFAGRAASSART
jgi:hypothetical protein